MSFSAWIDRILLCLLAGLYGFLPAAYGGVEPWSEAVFVGVVSVMGVLFLVRFAADPGCRLYVRGACWPVVAFLGLVILQVMPLPRGVVGVLSANAIGLREGWLGQSVGATATVSLYPFATASQLRLLLGVATLFLFLLQFLDSPGRVRFLLKVIFLVGIGGVVLAVGQLLFGNGRIYWVGPLQWQITSGSFVCHNHYSQFTTLALGAGLALLLLARQEGGAGRYYAGAVAAGCLVLVGGVLLSYSRAGVGSLVLASGVVGIPLMWRRRWRPSWWVMAGLAVVAAAVVVIDASQGWSLLARRIATLSSFRAYADRWEILWNLRALWGMFPVFGTGLGTFRFVYPPFEVGMNAMYASHAENEYAQMLTEMGLAGLAVIAWFIWLVGRSAIAAQRRRVHPLAGAAPGLMLALVAILIHSFTDFGQHLPAIAAVTAAFAAILVRLDRPVGAVAGAPAAGWPAGVRWRRGAAVLAVAPWLALAAWQANVLRVAQAAYREAKDTETVLAEAGSTEPSAIYQVLSRATLACELAPGNAEFFQYRGEARWRALSRLPGYDALAESGKEGVEGVEGVAGELGAAVEQDLMRARALVPMSGRICSTLGRFRWYARHDAGGSRLIEEATKLAPCDPYVLMDAATAALEQGRTEVALRHLRRIMRLQPGLGREVRDLCRRFGCAEDLGAP